MSWSPDSESIVSWKMIQNISSNWIKMTILKQFLKKLRNLLNYKLEEWTFRQHNFCCYVVYGMHWFEIQFSTFLFSKKNRNRRFFREPLKSSDFYFENSKKVGGRQITYSRRLIRNTKEMVFFSIQN